MDKTEMKDGIIHVGEQEFKGLMVKLIRVYSFTHASEKPKKIVLPIPDEVDGVEIELAEVEKHAVTS